MSVWGLIFWRTVFGVTQRLFRVRPLVLLLLGTYLVGCVVGYWVTGGR